MTNTEWDLRRMFPTDELWYAQLQKVKEMTDELAKRKGNCANSAEAFLKTLKMQLEIDQLFYELMVFANSNFNQNMADAKAKELYETVQNTATAVGQQLSFLAPEMMEYSYEDFEHYCTICPELEEYRNYAKDFFETKPHVLSTELETLMVRLNDVGESFDKIYEDLVINDIVFPEITLDNGDVIKANSANYQRMMGNQNRENRARYYNAFLGTFQSYGHTLSSIYYGSVKHDVFDAISRNYQTTRQKVMKRSYIPEEVYDNLIQTVRENTAPLQEYVAYRGKRMGLDKLYFYDLFVPLVKEVQRTYTYEQAQEIILKATAVLGDDYTKLVQRAFEERWIDVYPQDNKMTGAYSTGAYTSYPYILLNFTGTLDDVFTLAHELGHSMHTYLSCQNQPFVYSGYSLFCAEVASTLNEQLVSEYLYENSTSKDEKALLLDKKLNDLRSTLYRQTMFADFELQTHRMVENGETLMAEKLNALHGELNRVYYGNQFIVDDVHSVEWSRIPHFYRAYYVYQYATGVSAATALAKRILTKGQTAVDDYRKFLSGGGSLHPIEMLRVAGVDMASPEPILDTVQVFSETLHRLMKLEENA